MITRVALALTIAATLWFNPASARAAAPDVELISDPHFMSVHDPAAAGPWRCDDSAQSVEEGGPGGGAEFTQLIGARDGEVPGAVPPRPLELGHTVLGAPAVDSAAECAQVVPVQPGATYRLEMWVQGGPVVLGTGYGVVRNSSASATAMRKVTTSFTVGRGKRTVRVAVHGKRGAEPYYAWGASLVGPASTVQRPVAPTSLRTDRRTSRTVRLGWRGAPGATGYRVLRDGRSILTTTDTAAIVPDLTVDTSARLTVRALNPAGESPLSAAVTVGPLPAFAAVPDRPTDVVVTPVRSHTFIDLTPPARATDGYEVFVDGQLAGWMCESGAALAGLPDGPHVITVTALNALGASAPSDPVSIVIGEAV